MFSLSPNFIFCLVGFTSFNNFVLDHAIAIVSDDLQKCKDAAGPGKKCGCTWNLGTTNATNGVCEDNKSLIFVERDTGMTDDQCSDLVKGDARLDKTIMFQMVSYYPFGQVGSGNLSKYCCGCAQFADPNRTTTSTTTTTGTDDQVHDEATCKAKCSSIHMNAFFDANVHDFNQCRPANLNGGEQEWTKLGAFGCCACYTGGSSSGSSCSWWWIVLVAVGGGLSVLLLLIGLIVFCVVRHKRNQCDTTAEMPPFSNGSENAYPSPYGALHSQNSAGNHTSIIASV